ncbi:hypothetical protein D3C87_1911510 [compost metagenome]
MGATINTLNDAAKLGELLAEVVACVVTRSEHLRLGAEKASDGWERYQRAKPPVGVYDRLQKRWVVTPP